jgi:hypothetical protein
MADEETMKLSEARTDETSMRELTSIREDVSLGGCLPEHHVNSAVAQVVGAQGELEDLHETLAKENEHFRDGEWIGLWLRRHEFTITTVTSYARDGRGRRGGRAARVLETRSHENENRGNDSTGKWFRIVGDVTHV